MGLITALVLVTWRDAVPFIQLPMQLVSWGVSIWLGLRFCMVAPLIFNDRTFRLFESWRLTRGHVWNLFGVGFVMVLATAVVYVVLAAIGVAVAWPMFHSVAAVGSRAFFAQAPQQIWNQLSPLLIIDAAVIWVGSIVLLPMFFAPWPEAFRQLTQGHVAATFS